MFSSDRSASERVRLYGLTIVAGDLVAVGSDPLIDETLTVEDYGEGSFNPNTSSAETIHEHIDATADDAGTIATTVAAVEGNAFQRSSVKIESSIGSIPSIHIVTDADIAGGLYSIKDVILPLVGSQSIVPAHDIGRLIHSLLAEDGLSLATFSTCPAQYRSRGAYRRLLQFPIDFEHCVVHYNHVDDDLVETELTQMRHKDLSRRKSESDGMQKEHQQLPASSLPSLPLLRATEVNVAEDPTTETSMAIASDSNSATSTTEGKYRAAILRFTLPSGTYATIMLRELTKESTHQQYQAQLTSMVAHAHDHTNSSVEASSSSSSSSSSSVVEPSDDVDPVAKRQKCE